MALPHNGIVRDPVYYGETGTNPSVYRSPGAPITGLASPLPQDLDEYILLKGPFCLGRQHLILSLGHVRNSDSPGACIP